MLLRNVGNYLQFHTALQPRTLISTFTYVCKLPYLSRYSVWKIKLDSNNKKSSRNEKKFMSRKVKYSWTDCWINKHILKEINKTSVEESLET
jgi:hypothetical protein